jgi:hypothetical protein
LTSIGLFYNDSYDFYEANIIYDCYTSLLNINDEGGFLIIVFYFRICLLSILTLPSSSTFFFLIDITLNFGCSECPNELYETSITYSPVLMQSASHNSIAPLNLILFQLRNNTLMLLLYFNTSLKDFAPTHDILLWLRLKNVSCLFKSKPSQRI